MKKTLLFLLLLGTALPIAGCVVAPYPGYYRAPGCYYHRCW